MDSDRIKEIQKTTAYPDSVSVKQSLMQVWNETQQDKLHIVADTGLLPISNVVFFKLVDGKYVASNGSEVTTAFLLKYEHTIYSNSGFCVIKR